MAQQLKKVGIRLNLQFYDMATFDKALAGVEPDPVVIARDRMQPEQVQSLDQYLAAQGQPSISARDHQMMRARPFTRFRSTKPQTRESDELSRLSPITNSRPAGTVTSGVLSSRPLSRSLRIS